MNKKTVIIDTDPGLDDAMALLMALASNHMDIRGITTTAGNGLVEQHSKNAMSILEYVGATIPVYSGANQPILQARSGAAKIHGKSALGGINLPKAKKLKVAKPTAVEFMAKELVGSDKKFRLIALGPLTNLAILLASAPEVKGHIEEIILMGGAAVGGNRTPVAEFNIWQDPEAAHIVFASGIPIIMCGLDVTRKALLKKDDLERIDSVGGKAGRLFSEILKELAIGQKDGVVVHDAVAMARALKPDLFTGASHHVAIDLGGTHTRGCTVTDLGKMMGKEANAEVIFDLDYKGFVDLLVESCEVLNKKMGGNKDE